MIAPVPTPVELPANTVAIVARAHASHAVRIGKGDFDRALVQAAAVRGRLPVPKPGRGGYGKLKETAINELLEFVWIKGQAAEMGIGATRRQVLRQLALLKREAFDSGAEYRRFLKEAHYTRRDVIERVEVEMLVVRIQERVVAGIEGAVAQQRAFGRFVREFGQQWTARTVCAPEYATERCSNAPPSDGAPSRTAELVGRRFS